MSAGNTSSTQSGQKKKSKWWKKWLKKLIGLTVLAGLAWLITQAIIHTDFSSGIGWKGWVALTILVIVIGLLSYAIYLLTRKKKAADPHGASTGPHGGAEHNHGTPTMKFWEFVGRVLLPTALLLGASWIIFQKYLVFKSEQEAEEKAKSESPYKTYTSGSPATQTEKKHDTRINKRRLMPGVLLLVVVPDGNKITVTHTGGDFYSYVGNDTTDLLNKMALTNCGDNRDVPSNHYMAYMRKDNIICDITIEVTEENPYSPFEVYDITLK